MSGTWKRLTENVNELAGNLTRQVRAISQVTSAVATGDLTRSITVEAEGEVAELKDNINAMVQSLRESTKANEEQYWLKTNLARIAGLLQGHRDLTAVAEVIMDELIPLVGAQHGTFFIADDSSGSIVLRLIAGYGLRADLNAPSQFRLGQSLIGQVAKTRVPIVVTDAPPDYVRISSGLGEAAPVNLIVLPIVFEGRVLGVMEAGSFSRFTQVHQDFLEQLMEAIGTSVNTIIVNSRTDDLLQESQRLAGELQARTGELQVRQEELQRSNAELEDKAAQLAVQKRDIEIKNTEIEQARQEIEERARAAGPGVPLQVPVPRQCVARAAHPAQQPADPGPAAGPEPGREPHAQAGRVRERHPLVRVGPAAADQRHPGPVQGRGGQARDPPGAVRAADPGRGPAHRVRAAGGGQAAALRGRDGRATSRPSSSPTGSGSARSCTTCCRTR